MLFKRPAELARERLWKLAVNHFERYRERMTGSHGSGDEFQRIGKTSSNAFNRLARSRMTYKRGTAPHDSGQDKARHACWTGGTDNAAVAEQKAGKTHVYQLYRIPLRSA